MRFWAASTCVVIGLVAWLSAVPAQADDPGWNLVWSDEFNYTGVPDPAKWDYEVGYIRNYEKQYYTRARPENAWVDGSVLTITGIKESYSYPGGTADYTSASLITQGKESFQFGRIEMRAKLPQGQGVWPGFWTLGTNFPTVPWPDCGEIDIMEFIGRDPTKVYGTVHWGNSGGYVQEGTTTTVSKPWKHYHIYAIEWTADKIDFYYDQTIYFTFDLSHADYNGANAFRLPQYLLLSLALGGGFGGTLNDNILPQQFVVDYVRVYELPEPALPGDFNNDGAVNATDYVLWRKTNGPQSDYNTWRTNFGSTVSGSGSATEKVVGTAVPEPSVIVLSLLFAWLITRRDCSDCRRSSDT